MGNLKDVAGMIPGVGKALKNVDIEDDAFKSIEAIIQSMTEEEKENPQLLDGSRRKRIAKGSGNDVSEVNKLIKQFSETRKVMKLMSNKNNMAKMMQKMKNMPGMSNVGK